MPLYQVEDDLRPMFVVAPTYEIALKKWNAFVAKENDCNDAYPATKGIVRVADDDEILL